MNCELLYNFILEYYYCYIITFSPGQRSIKCEF